MKSFRRMRRVAESPSVAISGRRSSATWSTLLQVPNSSEVSSPVVLSLTYHPSPILCRCERNRGRCRRNVVAALPDLNTGKTSSPLSRCKASTCISRKRYFATSQYDCRPLTIVGTSAPSSLSPHHAPQAELRRGGDLPLNLHRLAVTEEVANKALHMVTAMPHCVAGQTRDYDWGLGAMYPRASQERL